MTQQTTLYFAGHFYILTFLRFRELIFKLLFLCRILDEFDGISLNSIIRYARKDRRSQFVFLTYLNTSNINVSDDIKISNLSKLPTD